MNLSLLTLQQCLHRFARVLSIRTCRIYRVPPIRHVSQIRGEKSYPADCTSWDREKTRDETKVGREFGTNRVTQMLGRKIRRRGMEILTRYFDCNFQTNERNTGYINPDILIRYIDPRR